MSTISVVVITYNEAVNIERCLKSVASVADEIIIIDSYSNDETEVICNKFKVNFIKRAFVDYAEQRNAAFKIATMEYLFFLDADEALSDILSDKLVQLKKLGMHHDAYKINRFNNFCGKWIKYGMWYPEHIIRIVKNGKGQWKGRIHEILKPAQGASVYFIKANLLHYSYTDIESLLRKINHYTSLQAIEMSEQHKKASLLKLFINPLWAFINGYFIRLGCLDGWRGYVISLSIAYQTMIKYAKLRRLNALKKEH